MAQTRICENCNQEYPARSAGKRFCSMSCRAQRQGDEERTRKQAEYLANPKLCECGQVVSYEKRHTNKYCSTACVNQFQPRRQADLANYHTFNCLNCDKEVTRRKSFNHGSAKYCSNNCSIRHTKTKHHVVLRDDDVLLDSAWEAAFWGIAKVAKFPIERFDRSQVVQWENPEGTIGGQYAPDFWLPSYRTAVEIKGIIDPEDYERWQAYSKIQGPLIWLSGAELAEVRPTGLAAYLESGHCGAKKLAS